MLGEIKADAEVPDLTAYFLEAFRLSAFTAQYNLTGQPAMSIPLHLSPLGLPIGAQFVGRYGEEETLLSLAGQLEMALPWASRHPPVGLFKDK